MPLFLGLWHISILTVQTVYSQYYSEYHIAVYVLRYIRDVRITDTDQPSHQSTDPTKVLLRQEKEKKDKYGALCIARRRTFTPLVFSVDGLLGKEATAASKRLASSLAAKWKHSYSEICGFVRSRLSIALIRSSSHCLRADRNPIRRFHPPIWDSGTGLGLYRM